MPRHRPGPVPDVFEAFPDRVEDAGAAGDDLPAGWSLARSAGLTVVLMVLTGLGAIGGAWVASGHTPDIAYTTLLWEGVALVLWCGLWGLLSGAGTLAAGVLVVALPWVRRRRREGQAEAAGEGATSTSRP